MDKDRNMNIRGLDEVLWRQCKMLAAREGVTLREWVLEVLRVAVARELLTDHGQGNGV